MKTVKKIKNGLIYLFVRFVFFFFNLISRKSAQKIGGKLGDLIYSFSEKDRDKAHYTLSLVYGNKLTATDREGIIKQFFINSGKNLADLIRFKKYYKSEIQQLVDVEGIEHFEAAYKRGKGIMAITGHIGNFELLAAYFSGEKYKTAVIGREMYDKRLDRLLIDNRESMGMLNIDTKDSPKKMLRILKEGYALGVLIDTDSMRVRSEFVPAFGIKSRTPIGQSMIGLKTGAAFIPMACVRNGDRYKIIIKPEITPERTGDFEKDVYNITLQCTKALEEIIDEYRDQWIWIHNRWNTRPPGEEGDLREIKRD